MMGSEALTRAIDDLTAADIPTAVGDAEIILAHSLGLTRTDVQEGAANATLLSEAQSAQIAEFVQRRKNREPLQHLTGKSLFRQLELAVGPGVFVPRRETEYVTQLAIDALRACNSPNPIAVDLGTGAGAIALSMATEVPNSTVVGVEISPDAFPWTQRNFETIAPHNSRALLADMADALHELDGQVDVVAGNPPFQPDGVESVTPEVRLFELPVTVFGGGSDGLDTVRALSKTALRLLRSGGTLAFEHGVSQSAPIADILRADGWDEISSLTDPRGRQRVTTARRP